MAKTKRYWKDSIQYKRILEILDDYWLTEPDEDYVRVELFFKKGNESQSKCITWRNPNKEHEEPIVVLRGDELMQSFIDDIQSCKY